MDKKLGEDCAVAADFSPKDVDEQVAFFSARTFGHVAKQNQLLRRIFEMAKEPSQRRLLLCSI